MCVVVHVEQGTGIAHVYDKTVEGIRKMAGIKEKTGQKWENFGKLMESLKDVEKMFPGLVSKKKN